MATPELLREAIERAIMSYDPIRTSETDIDIGVRDGDVTLNGYVRTDIMRSVARQLAGNVRGVTSVHNQLLSDSALEIAVAQGIELRLGHYIVPMMPVVRVIRGHVFLRGVVPSEDAKQLIGEVAERVPGVVMVHNHLEGNPAAVERLIAPKKTARRQSTAGAGATQAMVGGKPVTEADLPAWALQPKETWGMEEYKARAQAKIAFKQGEGPDPDEMEQAGTILRTAGDGEDESAPVAAEADAAPAAPLFDEPEEEPADAGPTMTLEEVQASFPAWALKPKEDWDKDDFKAQMQAKRAAKSGDGDPPETIIEQAQAALAAAQSGGPKKKAAAPANSQAAALAALRDRFPGWALKPRKEWRGQDFQEAADARVAELRGGDQTVAAIRAEAQEALEAVMRGEEVAGGARATRRELTPEEVAEVRAGLAGNYPAWALKPKEDWDKDDFKGQMQAKRAAKSGEGDPPETIIEQAQAALTAALTAAREALPLEGGDEPAPAADADPAEATGPREISPELLERFPGWALKAKEDWDAADFKAHAKAKSAFKKGEGPDPDALTAEAQAALG